VDTEPEPRRLDPDVEAHPKLMEVRAADVWPGLEPTPVATSSLLEGGLLRQFVRTLREIEVLQAYARSAGKQIPENTQKGLGQLAALSRASEGLQGEQVSLSLAVHGQLSALAAPATVRTLEATDPDQKWSEWITRFWVIPVIFGITVLALLALILLSPGSADASSGPMIVAQAPTSPGDAVAGTTRKVIAGGLLRDQLQNLVAAILGAGFYALFTAYGYIASRTFDPAYNIVYLVRFLLGVVSGTILANFGPKMGLEGFATTLLGLVGGYSAEAVNQILTRVGETLVAAVKGGSKELLKEREATLRSEGREQQAQQKQKTGIELAEVLKVAVDNKAPTEVINRLRLAMDTLNR
jgi:hypothetical protein